MDAHLSLFPSPEGKASFLIDVALNTDSCKVASTVLEKAEAILVGTEDQKMSKFVSKLGALFSAELNISFSPVDVLTSVTTPSLSANTLEGLQQKISSSIALRDGWKDLKELLIVASSSPSRRHFNTTLPDARILEGGTYYSMAVKYVKFFQDTFPTLPLS